MEIENGELNETMRTLNSIIENISEQYPNLTDFEVYKLAIDVSKSIHLSEICFFVRHLELTLEKFENSFTDKADLQRQVLNRIYLTI